MVRTQVSSNKLNVIPFPDFTLHSESCLHPCSFSSYFLLCTNSAPAPILLMPLFCSYSYPSPVPILLIALLCSCPLSVPTPILLLFLCCMYPSPFPAPYMFLPLSYLCLYSITITPILPISFTCPYPSCAPVLVRLVTYVMVGHLKKKIEIINI